VSVIWDIDYSGFLCLSSVPPGKSQCSTSSYTRTASTSFPISHYLSFHLIQNHQVTINIRKYTINKYHTVSPFIKQEGKLLEMDSNGMTGVESVEICYGIYSGIDNWPGAPL
jgi:hypothetical protein